MRAAALLEVGGVKAPCGGDQHFQRTWVALNERIGA
jgi:hypothetical protein